jgi:two-component system, OmpR family, sensor histidine kinase MtrB
MKGAATSRNTRTGASSGAAGAGQQASAPPEVAGVAEASRPEFSEPAASEPAISQPAAFHTAADPGPDRPRGNVAAEWLDSVSWPRDLLRIAARAHARSSAVARNARTRWRRSLQLRVVTATLVLSVVVVAVLGFFLIQQIANGLLQAKVKSAKNQAAQGLIVAEGQTGVAAKRSASTSALMMTIVTELGAQSSPASDFSVAIRIPPDKQGPPVYHAGASVGLPVDSIPARLTRQVERDSKNRVSTMSFTLAGLPFPGFSKPVPGVLVGAPFGSYYQLYYFFPLTQEQQSLALVQRTLLLVGLALVFLLAAIASLVTRWVVVPVARAAQGALRLSTGNLDERVQVRGTDELAGLATSFNEMAASLQEKMRELENLSQVQRQFVSDVSHELRTPLTTIRIAADLLYESREQLDGSAGRSAELLQSQVERFESLLVDLLEISRYDANAATLDAEPVDVCDLTRYAADVAQQLAERRGAKIEFRLPAEPCVAEVDRRRVERILRNLLVNAVEHGENRNAVVTVAGDSNAVAVAVRDYGVGLAPGEEHLAFDRFWRADPARARTTGGTGLGLAIALEDARLHGGWLEAWGESGRGSVFRLTLPRLAGGVLAGSPLPLGPDEAELDSVLAQRAGVIVGVVQNALRQAAQSAVGDAAGAGAGEASHG